MCAPVYLTSIWHRSSVMSHDLQQVTRTLIVDPVQDDATMSCFLIGREQSGPEREWNRATAHLDARRRDASVASLRSLREFSFSSVGFSSLNTFSNSQRLINFFNSHSGGWSPSWVHSARRPFTGLSYLPRVIMMMENLVEWRLVGEIEVLGENLPQRHSVHHKSHLTRPGLEPGPPRWEASD
jgi:hypothetical protein